MDFLKEMVRVYIEVVENCTRKELMPVRQGRILEESTINTDGWKAYNGLVFNGKTSKFIKGIKNFVEK